MTIAIARYSARGQRITTELAEVLGIDRGSWFARMQLNHRNGRESWLDWHLRRRSWREYEVARQVHKSRHGLSIFEMELHAPVRSRGGQHLYPDQLSRVDGPLTEPPRGRQL